MGTKSTRLSASEIELKTQQIDLNETRQNYKSGLLQFYSLCGIKDTEIVKIDSVDFEHNN